MRIKPSTIILFNLGLFFLISAPVLAGNIDSSELAFKIPGRIEGTGIFFEIKDSQYLNVSLESSEEIKLILESIPKIISLNMEATGDDVDSVVLVFKGLESNKTYYKYQNSYKNEAVFITDENGSFTWFQDLSKPHHIWIQEQKSTTYIEEDTILDSDITGSVEISTSGITLDCANHKITGNGSGYGIYLYNKTNVTVKNCNVSNFSVGLYLGGSFSLYNTINNNNVFANEYGLSVWASYWQPSSNNYIFENQIYSNTYKGMELYGSNSNQVIGNTISDNGGIGLLLNWAPSNYLRDNSIVNNDYNFGVYGGLVGGAQDIDISNTVNGKPIYYLVNEKDKVIDTSSNPGYIGLINSENIIIKDIIISNNVQGIYLERTTHSRIENAHLSNNLMGIEMNLCSNNEIIGNELSGNSWNGIRLWISSYNIFSDSDILNNGLGIELTGSMYSSSHDNKIYHNNFKKNQVHVIADRSYSDLFDDGYPSGGNYWSDYTDIDEKSGPNQDQPGSDGIGDTPYAFYGGQDRYPFMEEGGWEVVNQLPVFTNSNQYKSDAITQINEGQTTTESTVVFKAMLSDTDNDEVKLQVELKEYTQTFNGQDILESDFVGSGGEARITRYGLIKGQYHWRSRAVDSRGAVSIWQEFGEIGNVDFKVKLVPKYTQIQSPYPSRDETESWFNERYGNGGIGGYTEYKITLNNTDNYTLIVNGKDDEAVDSKTGKKITAKVGACLYKIKDKYGDPICVAEKMLSWPLGDNQYKSVSAALGRVIAGSYFLRLTSKEDYFDLNNPDESGNLNVYLDWFEFRNATSSLLRQEAENDVIFKGGTKTSDSGKAVVRIDGYSCGITIADCGCAMVSMVMLGRYYGINIGINGTGVTPLYMNDWLKKNDGYNKLGNLVWGKDKDIGAITYLGFKDSENITNVRLSLDVYNAATTSPAIDQYINSAKPAVVRSDKFGHYFVMDGKLASTYTIKDPFWYNTKTLNDNRNIGEHFQNYRGKIDAVNLFSYLSTPRKILSYPKSTSIYVASPVELLIIDPQGRKLGKDPTTGAEYNEIPDATYTYETSPVSEEPFESEGAPKIKVVDIPDTIDGKYNIKVFGLRSGSYTLEFFTNDTSGKVKDETISGSIDADIVQDFEFNYSSQNIEETQVQQIVPIDIKPSSFPNSVNCKNNKEIIPVAILTTPLFDATIVDADTVRFGPAGAQETHRDKKTGKAQRHVENVDNDGDLDLVFHFRYGDTGIQCSDEKAALTGLTINGHNIMGTDTVRTVKVSVLSASIIELPFQFFKSLAAKFAQWLGFLYEYFFSPEPTSSTQSEKITREPCLKEDEEVWVIPRYWSATYSYRFNEETVEPLTVYVYSEGVIPKEGVSEDEADRRVIEKNNFNFTISGVVSDAIPPEIRKCGIYVDKLFKDPPKRYEAWKYDYSGKGERIMVLDAFDEQGASIKESSNADYSPLFKIDETETYIALVRSWYGEPEKHALVIKDLKTLVDVYVITIKELMERYRIGLGTIQLSDARERFVLFEILNNENPWFGLNIETGELERTDILP